MVRCKKCGKEIKDKNWPVENTGGLCPDCAYEDFKEKGKQGKIVLENRKGKMTEQEKMKHKKWIMFEKQIAVFLGEFDAHVEIADEEDRFLTPEELRVWEQRLKRIWEEHIQNMGNAQWLELFRQCYSCQNRNSPGADTIMTLGVIRCSNQDCSKHKEFSRMFNQIYTRRDIDRAREHMDEMTRTPETEEEATAMIEAAGNKLNLSGEEMGRNTDKKQKEHIEIKEKEKESKEMMYQ